MILLKNTLLPGLLCFTTLLAAQTTLPVARNIQAAFDKGTRSPLGAPGKNYWQNFAAYDLKIRFDPTSRAISGMEDITYTNNSPDTLQEIIFKLYPNLFQQGAQKMFSIKATDLTTGVQFGKFAINDQTIPIKDLEIAGTNMRVFIKPLLPGQTLRFAISYTYTLNKGSHIRTGEIDEGAWFLAYFFPRIAVYDDLDGWNLHPYLGTQEFYNDFCNFKTAVTVPKDYVVWATGDLQNCAEVLSPQCCQMLSMAERLDGITTIIDSTDLRLGHVTANRPENTFRFSADNVTDVAVAISNHYLWKASSLVVDPATGRRVRVDAVFNARHPDFFEVIDFARKTVESMSFEFPRWPFPYAHETVFDGLDQMEYPMMVNDNPLDKRADVIELTDHEIFHTMFPFYMGINETKYGWMDEGWATMGEWLISSMIDTTLVDDYAINTYESNAGMEDDLPIMTLSTQMTGAAFGTNSYPKPALGYLYVKDLLGEDRFYKGLHHYIRDWNGKHPMPHDFFNSMNAGSGVNLNWFWKRWFFDSGVPDLAIASYTNTKKEKTVVVKMKGDKPVPVDVTVWFTDGSSEKMHRSVGVWEQGDKTVTVKFTGTKPVKEVTLGSTYVPDVFRGDNRFLVKP